MRFKHTIQKLTGEASEQQARLDAVAAANRALRIRALAAGHIVEQTEALLACAKALEVISAGGGPQPACGLGGGSQAGRSAALDGGGGGGGSGGGGRALDSPAASRREDTLLVLAAKAEPSQKPQLPGSDGAAPTASACETGGVGSGASSGAVGCGSDALPALQPNWWPASEAEIREILKFETVEELRGSVRDAVHAAGVLLPRVRGGEPNAAAALARLEALRRRSLLEVAVMALVRPELLAKMRTTPLVVGGHEVGPPSQEDLAYVGRQMALSEDQAETALFLLTSAQHSADQLEGQRNALLDRLCGGRAADGGGGGAAAAAGALAGAGGGPDLEAFQQLARVTQAVTNSYLSCCLALFDGVLTVQQYCDYSLAVYPRTLGLHHMGDAIRSQLLQARAAAAGSAAATEEPEAP